MRRAASWVIVFAFMSLTVAVSYGQPEGKEAGKTKRPKISMAQARQTAMERAPGKVKSSELERENGVLVYSFDIQTDKGIREVQVDANSGKIVADEIETPAQEASEAAKDRAAHSKTVQKKTADPK